jgi:hypothetical protein
MQSDCVDLGQQITIYRLKPVDGEILIEETGTVIYVTTHFNHSLLLTFSVSHIYVNPHSFRIVLIK